MAENAHLTNASRVVKIGPSTKYHFPPRIVENLLRQPTVLIAYSEGLLTNLLHPPAPWKSFGTHTEHSEVALEFWGESDDGFPWWERPLGPVLLKPECSIYGCSANHEDTTP